MRWTNVVIFSTFFDQDFHHPLLLLQVLHLEEAIRSLLEEFHRNLAAAPHLERLARICKREDARKFLISQLAESMKKAAKPFSRRGYDAQLSIVLGIVRAGSIAEQSSLDFLRDELGKNPEIFGDVFFDLFAISCFAEELGPAMMLPVLVGKQGSSQNGAAQLGIISNGNGGVGGGERVSLSSDNEGIVGAHMPIANGGGENEGHGANSVPTTTSDPVLVQLSPPIPRLELVEDETIIFSNGAAGAGSKRSPAELLRADARPPARTVPAVFIDPQGRVMDAPDANLFVFYTDGTLRTAPAEIAIRRPETVRKMVLDLVQRPRRGQADCWTALCGGSTSSSQTAVTTPGRENAPPFSCLAGIVAVIAKWCGGSGKESLSPAREESLAKLRSCINAVELRAPLVSEAEQWEAAFLCSTSRLIEPVLEVGCSTKQKRFVKRLPGSSAGKWWEAMTTLQNELVCELLQESADLSEYVGPEYRSTKDED